MRSYHLLFHRSKLCLWRAQGVPVVKFVWKDKIRLKPPNWDILGQFRTKTFHSLHYLVWLCCLCFTFVLIPQIGLLQCIHPADSSTFKTEEAKDSLRWIRLLLWFAKGFYKCSLHRSLGQFNLWVAMYVSVICLLLQKPCFPVDWTPLVKKVFS